MQVILLSYPGVMGEVTIAGYTNMVACQSLSMNASEKSDSGDDETEPDKDADTGSRKPFDSPIGFGDSTGGKKSKSKSAASRRVGIDNISITKTVDQATPSFLQMAFQTKQGTDTAIIVVFRAFETGLSDLSTDASSVGGSVGNSSDILTFGLLDTPMFWHKPFLTITLTGCSITSHDLSISGSDMSETITIGFKKLQMQYTVFVNGVKSGNVLGNVDLTQESSSSDSG